MAKKLDPMDLKQIIRLHLDGMSNRQVGALLSISRNTINTYIQLFTASSWSLEELLGFSQAELEEHFTSRTTIDNERYNELMSYFETMNQARHHPGFTFQYHYQEYRQQSNHPYGYTQFMEHYKRKYAKLKGAMKLDHPAGDEVMIDFAGKKLFFVDKATGEEVPVEVFVATLPHSQYTYVEACISQKREDLVKCMGNALSFFGGVPKAIISDNLKSAVSRSHKHEAQVNRTFKDFAHHYGCVVNPTRSYKPQDKALVENAVNLVYQRIYYPLRAMTFFSLADLNKEVRKLLERYNDLLFQRKEASRKELFQSVERTYLKPLPDQAYQLKEYRRAKVQKMGYVYFSPDKSYYSVPSRYIGKHTLLHYTPSMLEVYYNHERIASHPRNPKAGSYNTIKTHLSSDHQAYSDWNPDYFDKLAGKHGQDVQHYIKGVLACGEYPQTNYKRAMGIIQLAKQYGSERLNSACQRALHSGRYSFHLISNILKNKLDTQQLDMEGLFDTQSHIPNHDNIRGASSYQ